MVCSYVFHALVFFFVSILYLTFTPTAKNIQNLDVWLFGGWQKTQNIFPKCFFFNGDLEWIRKNHQINKEKYIKSSWNTQLGCS